jgi:hypothetical protein
MVFVVSTTYFTIAYSYLTDSRYTEQEYSSVWENPNFMRIVVLLTIFYLAFKRQNAIVS